MVIGRVLCTGAAIRCVCRLVFQHSVYPWNFTTQDRTNTIHLPLPMWVRPLNWSTFTRPKGQRDYQDVYTEHALTNCLHWHFQPVPDPVCNTYMFQADHHSPCAQEHQCNLPKWLPTCSLTSVAMKCFERLVMAHISTIIPDTLDPLQFVYFPNRSAISIALHTALSHLDKRKTNVRMLLIDYNSAFDTNRCDCD